MESAVHSSARRVHDFSELIQEVGRTLRAWDSRSHGIEIRSYFRGVDRASYSLDQTLIRPPYLDRDPQELEFNIWQDFRTRGRPYLPPDIRSEWEEMFVMRHHGFPTRLLDWTESLSCAVYFATRDIREQSNGAVWMLATPFLVKTAFNVYATHLHTGSPDLHDYALRDQPRDLDAFNRKPPLPIIPAFVSPRLIAQHGRFTVHTFQPNALEALGETDRKKYGDQCFLHKIILAGDCKTSLRQQARVIGGACENTLFPDLDGLARSINWQFALKGNEAT